MIAEEIVNMIVNIESGASNLIKTVGKCLFTPYDEDALMCLLKPPPMIYSPKYDNFAKLGFEKFTEPVVDLMVLYEKSLVRLAELEEDLEKNKDEIKSLETRLYVPKMETYLAEESKVIDTPQGHGFHIGVGLSPCKPYIGHLNFDYKYDNTTPIHTENKTLSREVIVRDPIIEQLLAKEKDTTNDLRKEIEKLKKMAEEYQTEAKVVLGVVAKFTVFLKQNDMIANNDPFQEYLENIVEEEKVGGGRQKLIEALQNLLTRYQVKIKGTSEVLHEEVKAGLRVLIKLKNTGPTFSDILFEEYDYNKDKQSFIASS